MLKGQDKMTGFTQNDTLKTIKKDWAGTPIDDEGRFINYEFPFEGRFLDVLKWKLSSNPFAEQKKNEVYEPIINDPRSFFESSKEGIVWLGHACFFIRLQGKHYLIDPVFYGVTMVKQCAPYPCEIKDLPRIDVLLVSHDHRDHCDKKSISEIVEKNPNIQIVTGLNMEELLQKWVKNRPIHTAGWFQTYNLEPSLATITFVPSRHWSKRSLSDDNSRLWGGFVISGEDKTIYFGGDSGVGRHFKDIANLFPKIDYAIIGIGAYEPRWFMHANHASPEEAVEAFYSMGAAHMIPMHYGMYDLSDEPLNEPLKLLHKQASILNIEDKMRALPIGGWLEWQ